MSNHFLLLIGLVPSFAHLFLSNFLRPCYRCKDPEGPQSVLVKFRQKAWKFKTVAGILLRLLEQIDPGQALNFEDSESMLCSLDNCLRLRAFGSFHTPSTNFCWALRFTIRSEARRARYRVYVVAYRSLWEPTYAHRSNQLTCFVIMMMSVNDTLNDVFTFVAGHARDIYGVSNWLCFFHRFQKLYLMHHLSNYSLFCICG